jgi:hypothetical protein
LDNYAKKSDLENFNKRLERCEKKVRKAKDNANRALEKSEEVQSKVSDLNKAVEEHKKLISNKVDFSVFDEEINNLKNLIN